MSFTNPRKVTVTVLTYGLDYYYWPCISGESFPPALTATGVASTTYSSQGNYPAIFHDITGASFQTGAATWPVMPWVNPRTNDARGFNCTFNLWIQPQSSLENNFTYMFGLGTTVNHPNIRIQGTNPGSGAQMVAQISTGTQSNSGPATIITTHGGLELTPGWMPVTLSYDYATGFASATVDGFAVTWAHAFTGGASTPKSSLTTGGTNTQNIAYISSLHLSFN